jgi:integrase
VLMLSDGKLNAKVEVTERVDLGEFFKRYQANRPPGKEGNTAYTEDIHIRHLLRLLGERTALPDVPGKLQAYVTARAKEETHQGGTVSRVTIKKELGTLTSLWNRWGANNGLVTGTLSLRNLEYPKKADKAPFQTWDQIKRRIDYGQFTEEEQAELWDALYLTVPQVEELLGYVKTAGCLVRPNRPRRTFPWVYPMFAFCAYTGARRSEMLRSRVEDLDFEGDEVRVREKKKDRTKRETFRHVPMVPELKEVLRAWLEAHPDGPYTFSKNAGEPLTEQMATHYLRWTLAGSKWAVVRGWHVLRHSLISNMVSRGVPERVLMEVAGHLNAETSRRYQHLLPSTVRDAFRLVFGGREGAQGAEPR